MIETPWFKTKTERVPPFCLVCSMVELIYLYATASIHMGSWNPLLAITWIPTSREWRWNNEHGVLNAGAPSEHNTMQMARCQGPFLLCIIRLIVILLMLMKAHMQNINEVMHDEYISSVLLDFWSMYRRSKQSNITIFCSTVVRGIPYSQAYFLYNFDWCMIFKIYKFLNNVLMLILRTPLRKLYLDTHTQQISRPVWLLLNGEVNIPVRMSI